MHRLLRRKAPGGEIAADRAQPQTTAGPALDQLADRRAGPERKRQAELVGAALGDQAPDQGFLARGQGLLFTGASAAPPTGQGRRAGLPEGAHPGADKAAVDPDCRGHLGAALAGQHQLDRHAAQFGLGRRWKLAKVTLNQHARNLGRAGRIDTCLPAWLVISLRRTTQGGQPHYSALAILTALTLRAVFRLALRQTEGLIGSILRLLGLDLAVPDHSTLSRRAEALD